MFVDEHPQPLPLLKILALKIKNAPRTQIVYDNFPKTKWLFGGIPHPPKRLF